MLHFNGLEPIDFKGHLCEPKIDNEKRLRLAKLKFDTESQISEANDVLASCFDDDFAKNFIREKLSIEDKMVLQVYLTGGETGVNRLSRASDASIEKYLERAMPNVSEGSNNA